MSVATLPRPQTMTALRVCMCTDSYLPRVSGVVHSVAAFASALRRRGHHVVIAAPAYPGFVDADPDVVRFPSIRWPYPDFPLAVPLEPSAWRRLHAQDFDVVHAHSPFLMGAAAAYLARQQRAPLVFSHHTLYDEYVHYVPWVGPGVTRPAVLRYTTAYANRCDCVIAPSRAVVERLRDRGVRARIELLPTGTVDPEAMATLDPGWVRPVFGIPAGRPLLVTASRLGKEKSVDLLLDAFARILSRQEASLLIVGDGPEAPALREQALRLGVDAHTVFAGPQPHRKTLECLAAADIFVFASQTETQGMAVIEAMAAGLPVVAVAAGGVADAVRDGESGFLVDPSADALAARVLALLNDPSRRASLGGRAKDAAMAFSLEALTDRLVTLYRSLVPVPYQPGAP